MQKNGLITHSLSSDSEYKKMLSFCIEHGLFCFEYHYRHRIRNNAEKKRKGGALDDRFKNDRE